MACLQINKHRRAHSGKTLSTRIFSNRSEAVKKSKMAGIRVRKLLIIKEDFLRFSELLNFFTASQ